MANTHSTDLERSSSQYFSITDASQSGLDITGDLTVEGWIKLESLASIAGLMQILSKFDTNATANRNYYLQIFTDDTLGFQFNDGTGNETQFSTDSAFFTSGDVGNWVHFAVSVDVSTPTMTIYKNGLVVASSADSTNATSIGNGSAPFQIGAFNISGSPTRFLDGKVNNIRVWSDIRTASEIQDNIGADTLADTTNLEGWWKFNNDATDESSNSNDLTANNSPTYTTDVPFSGELVDVSTDSTLATNLVSYWELEEASGTRVDSHGSNDLTDNNTVTSGTGIQGDGADFEASNSEYLSIADASQSGLDVTTGLSFSFWMNLESAAAFDTNKGIFSKTNRTNGGYLFGYRQYPLNNDNFYFETYNGGTLTFAVSGDLNLSTSTFYHIVATFNSGTFNLYVNGVNQTFTKTGSGTTISDSSDPFYLGRLQHDGSSYFDGIIDEFGLWNRALTAGEVHNLYNSGSGLPYQAAVAATFTPKVMWL